MAPKKNSSDKARNKLSNKKPTMAELADRHILYQKSVQDPATEIGLMVDQFKRLRGRPPKSLREDFCGTALLAVEWCKGGRRRSACGVDLCEKTLSWAREHNLAPAGPDVGSRVQLLQANVLTAELPAVDLTCAFNFSYNGFKTRGALLEYLRAAYRGLKEDGVLVLDAYGGTQAITTLKEEREVDDEDFSYIWEQKKFNPITNEILCHIHFKFPDGSRIKKAFTYDWRLWTLPELSELLHEAGFKAVHVLWEEYEDGDEDDEYLQSTGRYLDVKEVENQESWVSYVFAEK